MVYGNHARKNISASRTSRISKRNGLCSSKSVPIPRISTISRSTGLQAQRLALPPIQYTAREVRSGMLFWAFAEKRSAAASAVFAARIQQLVDRCGISLRDLLWQTDNGGEFKGDFPKALRDRQHVRSSRQPRIPLRAMWRPFIAWKKTSSLTSKSSEAEAISLLRTTPISCT